MVFCGEGLLGFFFVCFVVWLVGVFLVSSFLGFGSRGFLGVGFFWGGGVVGIFLVGCFFFPTPQWIAAFVPLPHKGYNLWISHLK